MFAQLTGGKPRSTAERYEKCVFSGTVSLVRPKTRDKWLKVSHDTGSALIHDVIVQLYRCRKNSGPPGLMDPQFTDSRTGGPRGPPVLGPVDSPLNRWTPIACMAPYTLLCVYV